MVRGSDGFRLGRDFFQTYGVTDTAIPFAERCGHDAIALKITGKAESQLQLHSITKQKQFAVPEVPYSIRANVSSKQLNVLVNTLLRDAGNAFNFNFCRMESVKIPLWKHLKERDVSFEDTVELEWYPAPKPQDCLLHDENLILTGCYDNTLNLWTTKGKHKLTIPGHIAPVKGVKWNSLDEEKGMLASSTQDQTVVLWEWNVAANFVECVQMRPRTQGGLYCGE